MAIELYRHYRPWMAMHGAMAMAGYPIMAISPGYGHGMGHNLIIYDDHFDFEV